jgi:hypothetical protein
MREAFKNGAVMRASVRETPLQKSDILVCRLCRMEAAHNEVLGVSFCPIHGLGSPLDHRGVPRSFKYSYS